MKVLLTRILLKNKFLTQIDEYTQKLYIHTAKEAVGKKETGTFLSTCFFLFTPKLTYKAGSAGFALTHLSFYSSTFNPASELLERLLSSICHCTLSAPRLIKVSSES